jgi:hypothetical protein
MAIEYIITRIGDTSIRADSYEVRMRQDAAYRRAVVQVPEGASPAATVATGIETLWDGGETVTGEWFVAAQQRQALPVYVAAQMAMHATLMTTADMDAMNVAGAGALAASDAVLAGWIAYRDVLKASKGGDLTPFELHMAMVMYTLVGRQAAGG